MPFLDQGWLFPRGSYLCAPLFSGYNKLSKGSRNYIPSWTKHSYIGKSVFRILIIAPGDGISFNTLLGTILFDTKRWRDGLEVLARAAADIDGMFPQGRNALVSACEMQDVAVVEGVVSSTLREVGHCWTSMLRSSKNPRGKKERGMIDDDWRRLVSMRLVRLKSKDIGVFFGDYQTPNRGVFNDGNESPSPKRKENQRKSDLLIIGFGAIPISLKYHFLKMWTWSHATWSKMKSLLQNVWVVN